MGSGIGVASTTTVSTTVSLTVTTFSTTSGVAGAQADNSAPALAPAARCRKSRRLSFSLLMFYSPHFVRKRCFETHQSIIVTG